MKKYVLYAVILLWIILIAKSLTQNNYTKSVALCVAFEQSAYKDKWENLNTCVEGYGKFGVCYLTIEEKEKIVKNLAMALGIVAPYSLSSETEEKDIYETTLVKDGVNGRVEIKAITDKKVKDVNSYVATQYVYANINIYNNIECANEYRDLLNGAFDSMGIEGNVNVNLTGSIEGALNLEEKNMLADELLDKLKASVIIENRGNDMFTVYAYSKKVGDFIEMAKSRVNVNICIDYDENKDRTNVYLASPFNSLDY